MTRVCGRHVSRPDELVLADKTTGYKSASLQFSETDGEQAKVRDRL